MASTNIVSAYIQKLSHPIPEIRARSLRILLTKLSLGCELEDELLFTRELVKALIAWFQEQKPFMEREALELFITVVKTKAGTYIVREYGINNIIEILKHARHQTESTSKERELYVDLIETLKFLNTVQSEENMTVPRLNLYSDTNSESEDVLSDGYYNVNQNSHSSEASSISHKVTVQNSDKILGPDGVRILLLPWVHLCPSDLKTLLLVEDALKLLKSIKRCCRFINDVFLQDFPTEIFLNRPQIVKQLLKISSCEQSAKSAEAFRVLFSITQCLRKRIQQLSSIHLINIHYLDKFPENAKELDNTMNTELQKLSGRSSPAGQNEDELAALRQMPLPIYSLDSLQEVLMVMTKCVVPIQSEVSTDVDMRELQICLSLVDSLISLLLDCISDTFWMHEHSSKTNRDIAHKSCTVMRLLGDLMLKYRKSYLEDCERTYHRVAWFRLTISAKKLLYWSRLSILPPSSLVAALQAAILDPGLDIFYPELCGQIANLVQDSKKSVDQEFKTKYKQLSKLFKSMKEAAKFMKSKKTHTTSNTLLSIKNSLSVLELHLNEGYLDEVCDVILNRTKELKLDDSDWSIVRSIALSLMAHNVDWVAAKFYTKMADMVKLVLIGDDVNQSMNEQCLSVLSDVGVLTEICCHGLSSSNLEVRVHASEILLYLLRGRLVLSPGCWWRLLASLLPVLPLLHVYAAHDTQLGQAICKSLEPQIAECMGVSHLEVFVGLVRLLFVKCDSVQLDAAHSLCRMLDDPKYLPPKESLRTDVLMNAISRVEPQDFNIDTTGSPKKNVQLTGLMQILDVLKQDIVIDDHDSEYMPRSSLQPSLEPSLRRSTLQQLSVMMRRQEFHDSFIQCDGLRLIVAILRMSLLVDDYLAFPECAISCVSVLNSVSFTSRHTLAKIPDLPALLLRVILVFPANDSAVVMSAQVLALTAWSGFVLQELNPERRRVPALPLSVTRETKLPFMVNSYWSSSPNAEHSSIEWLLAEEDWRASIRTKWWVCWESVDKVIKGAAPPPAPALLRPSPRDLSLLRAASITYTSMTVLLKLESATSHRQVNDALYLLESYIKLVPATTLDPEFVSLPWQHMKRFLAPPASPRDISLLINLLQFILIKLDYLRGQRKALAWIKSLFIDNDTSMISILSRDQLYPQQTQQESIELTQLHIHIVKVLQRCIKHAEINDIERNKMESLVKILLACLERVDLKNFHMLGYLNELVNCISFAVNSSMCQLTEDSLLECLSAMTRILAGCASGTGRKGQACRLNALLTILALLKHIQEQKIPVQRWSETLSGQACLAVVLCFESTSPELRAASLHVTAALAHYAQLLPHLLQAIRHSSLSQYACYVLCQRGEANVVRTAAATLLTVVSSRASPKSDILECDILEQIYENSFLDNCLQIFVDFCNEKECMSNLEPNVPISVLERRLELEVRAQKCGDVHVLPLRCNPSAYAPPTPDLIQAVADVLHNISVLQKCPVQEWNEQGLYRLLFRYSYWYGLNQSETNRVRASLCRALVAACSRRCVRNTLANTKDCLHSLLDTLKSFQEDDYNENFIRAHSQALLLVGTLLSEKAAAETVWQVLKGSFDNSILHLILQNLQSNEEELKHSALYCLTQLCQSLHKKNSDVDKSNAKLLDDVKSPLYKDLPSNRSGAGDSTKNGCQPEYMVEELCKTLINIYQNVSLDVKKYRTNDGDSWTSVCSCLSSLLSVSRRSREYGVHRQMARTLLSSLQAVRDHLSLQGKPAEVIRQANYSPVLHTLYWLLLVITCLMKDCLPAKIAFAEDNLATSLNRLWPWCMITEQLRETVMNLLFVYTNDCEKGCSSLCVCVGGECILGLTCSVVCREAALQSRARSDRLLVTAINVLRHCVGLTHCRLVILKSSALASACKGRARAGGAAGGAAACAAACARLCVSLSRRADAAAAVLALRPPPPLPALAHAAVHHRNTFLQSSDLLEVLSGALLTGDAAQVVFAARAVWALAANNHKAKLLLRSAGVTAAVQSAHQRFAKSDDAETQRALQLLTYTNTVLQP